MKKILSVFFLLLVFTVLYPFQYNFMNNEKVIKFTETLLKNEGIAQTNIDLWEKMVNLYNQNIDFYNATKTGWKESGAKTEFFDHALDKFDYGRLYVNCRMSLYILIKDVIQVETYTRENETRDHIINEIARMKEYIQLSPMQEAAYKSLFNPIGIPKDKLTDKSFDTALETYQAFWKKEGLRFPENPNLQIIQVVVVRPEYQLAFCDHAALAVIKKDRLYLIEKSNPFSPYLITEHSGYEEMGLYLTLTFKDFKGSGIMILANDRIVWNTVF